MDLSVNDHILSLAIRHHVDVSRYSNGLVRSIIGQLNDANAELVDMIRKRGEKGPFTTARLKSMVQAIHQMNADSFAALYNEMETPLFDFAGHEAEISAQMLNKATPIALDIVTPDIEKLKVMVTDSAIHGHLLKEWFDSLEASMSQKVTQQIRLGVVEGEGIDAIVRRLTGPASDYEQGIFAIVRRQSEAVVRTAVAGVSNSAIQATYNANQDIIKGVQWHSTLDLRTTPYCKSMDGMVFGVNEGPRPPAHINCLPGDALVLPRGRVLAASKRWYDGDMVIIKTASGRVFTSTPNHPVLTSGGWIVAGRLNVGGDVISDSGSQWGSFSNCNDQEMPSRIEDIAEAFFRSSEVVSRPVPVTSEDFHGDGMGSKVAVVSANRELWFRDNPPFGQHISKHPFVLRHNSTAGLGSANKFGFRNLTPPCRIMGRFRQCAAFFRSIFSHTSKLLFATVTSLDTCISKRFVQEGARTPDNISNPLNSDACVEESDCLGKIDYGFRGAGRAQDTCREFEPNSLMIDAVLARNILDGRSGEVFVDKIVSIRSEPFSAHVYNLQTETNWYVAQGIVSHNCRSFTIPILKSWKELGIPLSEIPESTRSSMTGQVPESMTYNDWLKGQDAEAQKEALGATRAKLFHDGGLDMQSFVNDKRQLLTLDQLKERESAAFTKAFGK